MPDTVETPLLLNPKTRDYAELDPRVGESCVRPSTSSRTTARLG